MKCNYPACNCGVEEEEKFCSETCEIDKEAGGTSCRCGHAECGEQPEKGL